MAYHEIGLPQHAARVKLTSSIVVNVKQSFGKKSGSDEFRRIKKIYRKILFFCEKNEKVWILLVFWGD